MTRLRLHDDGFPPPHPQYWIAGSRVDFRWPELRLVLKVDGRLKYRTPAPGEPDPLWEEKKRESALRRAGYRVVERVLATDVYRDWTQTSSTLRQLFPFKMIDQQAR